MKISKALPLTLIFATGVSATTLDEISNFASKQCEEIRASGNLTKSQISAKLKGEAKALNKLLGGQLSADGTYSKESQSYEGVPFDQIAAQLTDVRSCKQNLTKLILEKSTLDQNGIKKAEINIEKIEYKKKDLARGC